MLGTQYRWYIHTYVHTVNTVHYILCNTYITCCTYCTYRALLYCAVPYRAVPYPPRRKSPSENSPNKHVTPSGKTHAMRSPVYAPCLSRTPAVAQPAMTIDLPFPSPNRMYDNKAYTSLCLSLYIYILSDSQKNMRCLSLCYVGSLYVGDVTQTLIENTQK